MLLFRKGKVASSEAFRCWPRRDIGCPGSGGARRTIPDHAERSTSPRAGCHAVHRMPARLGVMGLGMAHRDRNIRLGTPDLTRAADGMARSTAALRSTSTSLVCRGSKHPGRASTPASWLPSRSPWQRVLCPNGRSPSEDRRFRPHRRRCRHPAPTLGGTANCSTYAGWNSPCRRGPSSPIRRNV